MADSRNWLGSSERSCFSSCEKNHPRSFERSYFGTDVSMIGFELALVDSANPHHHN